MTNEEYIKAIDLRTSRRTYKTRALPKEILDVLRNMVDAVNETSGLEFQLVEDGTPAFKIFSGKFSYIAVCGEDTEKARIMSGYWGESIVLQCVYHGLGTCWVSGTYNEKAVITRNAVGDVTITASMTNEDGKDITKSFTVTGRKSTTDWKIVLKDTLVDGALYVDDPATAEPTVCVMENGKELTKNTDYSIRYEQFPGWYETVVYVTGMGDYSRIKEHKKIIEVREKETQTINGADSIRKKITDAGFNLKYTVENLYYLESIGGKTGVDYLGYKNMVGAFHMPAAVVTNPLTLESLPDREYISGFAEIIKHALIADDTYFDYLYTHHEAAMQHDYDVITEIIYRSCNIKKTVVEEDPTEKGIRAHLNFGHTAGHAIEKYMNFELLHGECISLGCIVSLYISYKRGNISLDDYNKARELFSLYRLPVSIGKLDNDAVVRITRSDKKADGKMIRFILLRSIGQAYIDTTVTEKEIIEALNVIQEV